jgi:acyl-CoA reductase-like NAD-dependent aldehyde dehydrogenase
MYLAQEEVFGPVLGVLTFNEEEELIALANQTRYGLAAGIWINDIKRAHRVARDL